MDERRGAVPHNRKEDRLLVRFLENPREVELALIAGLVRSCFLGGGQILVFRVKRDGTYGQRMFDGTGMENLQPYELGENALKIARVIKDSDAAALCPPLI